MSIDETVAEWNSKTWDNPEFVRILEEEYHIKGKRMEVLVHSNPHKSIYLLASKGVINLHYDPNTQKHPRIMFQNEDESVLAAQVPGGAMVVMKLMDKVKEKVGNIFNNKKNKSYPVPSQKALELGQMILNEKSPDTIVYFLKADYK